MHVIYRNNHNFMFGGVMKTEEHVLTAVSYPLCIFNNYIHHRADMFYIDAKNSILKIYQYFQYS